MSDILEISSDSSDTIILPSEASFSHNHESSDEAATNALVMKYLSENYETGQDFSKSNGEFNYRNYFDDDLCLEPPINKRPRVPSTKLDSSFSENIYSYEDNTSDTEVLQMLHEKYKYTTVDNFPESGDVETKENVSEKELKKLEKEAQRKKKREEREQKKNEAIQEKSIKQALATANKNIKPTECMKFITIFIDSDIISDEYGSEIVSALTALDVQYTVQSQIFPHTITWKRKSQSHLMDPSGKLVLTTDEEETDQVLLIMNCKEFLNHTNNSTLCSHVQSMKSVLVNKNVVLIIYGLQSYHRFMKNQKQSEMRSQITDEAEKPKKHNSFFVDHPKISKKRIEYGLTELQLICSCSHRFVNSPAEIGLLASQYTKAVAEIPFKLTRHEKLQQTDWFAAGDNRDCVKVDKNGNGLNRLWNQVLTVFPLARLETAEAITTKYPTVATLMQAYENCKSVKEGETLLQDIPVRRAAGPLSSSRKIGRELSKKIHTFFTSTDGDSLL